VRPVKGQLLRLRHPGNLPPIATHTIRALVQGRDIYIVPRADGELVVGGTQEERDDTDATAGAVHDLLRDATAMLPAVSELILAEINVGLRPGSADNGPIVGRLGDRLIVATGHYRNGILLSAVTADAVAELLRGEAPRPQWAPFTPGRLA
jgi:glycine oxidase